MMCPKCKKFNVRCIDSRPGVAVVRRRRECANCGWRFGTLEIAVSDLEDALGGYDELHEFIEDLEY